MGLLKASEAVALAKKNNIEGIMEEISKRITESAEDGKFELKIRGFGFSDSGLYMGSLSEKQEEIINRLKSYGYSAKLKVEELQLVDIYLHIQW